MYVVIQITSTFKVTALKVPLKDVTLSPKELQSVKDGKSLYVYKSNN
jgi:hypothetical protein